MDTKLLEPTDELAILRAAFDAHETIIRRMQEQLEAARAEITRLMEELGKAREK